MFSRIPWWVFIALGLIAAVVLWWLGQDRVAIPAGATLAGIAEVSRRRAKALRAQADEVEQDDGSLDAAEAEGRELSARRFK